MRLLIPMFLIVASVALFVLWTLRPPAAMIAEFAHDACRHVEIVERREGNRIVGIEDIALWRDGKWLVLSAHDRRRPNRDGGIYALPISQLTAASAEAIRLDEKGGHKARFRPHGIAISNDGTRLAVVNRYRDGAASIEIGNLQNFAWQQVDVIEDNGLCRANDLFFSGADAVQVTLDRGSCGFSIGDVVPWAVTGQVVQVSPRGMTPIRQKLAFPNGIINGFVAETRRRRLATAKGTHLRLSGGPDNLSLSQTGDIIAALHPNLFRLFLMRLGWLANAPSRISRLDPGSGSETVVFDDPQGDLFPAATSAVVNGGMLVAGSAYGHGLLVCGGNK